MSWNAKSIAPPDDLLIQLAGMDNTIFTCVGKFVPYKKSKTNKHGNKRRFMQWTGKDFEVEKDSWLDAEAWRVHEFSGPQLNDKIIKEAFEYIKERNKK